VLLLCSVLGGAAWASIAAWLHVKRGVQVVISTILLNFIALQFVGWAVENPLQEAKHQLPQTDALPDALMLWRPNRQLDFHAGVFIAILLAVATYVLLYRTTFGFRIRLVGANARAARASRVNSSRIQFQALALSGGLCGLAGGIEYSGMIGTLGTSFSQGWGFMAIPVALIGGLNPFGTLLSATLFGGLFAGTENLARFTTGGPTLLYVVQAITVLALVGARVFTNRAPQKHAEAS
jgi:simple sugar transport system permease protein